MQKSPRKGDRFIYSFFISFGFKTSSDSVSNGMNPDASRD